MSHAISPPRRLALERASSAERVPGEGVSAWAARVLADQAMPLEEIAAILSTADRRLIRRFLELHVERLEESLSAQLRTVDEIEELLLLNSHAVGAQRRGM